MGLSHLDYRIQRVRGSECFMRTDLLVLYLLEGTMEVRYYGDVIPMQKEDLLLINPGIEYEIVRAADAICGTAVFPAAVITEELGESSALFYVDSVRGGGRRCQELREIFRELTAEYILHAHRTEALTDSLLLKLLDLLIERYRLRQEISGGVKNAAEVSDARMQQILQYIVRHINGDLSLTDLAEKMYVSPSTLSRLFKKHTGLYFADYVMELRVRSSLSLLANSDQSLTQIAMNCGFSNSAAFNRGFKKVTGMTPSEYRKEKAGQAEDETKSEHEEEELREELSRKGYQLSGRDTREEIRLDLPALCPRPLRPVWRECINIGDLYELGRANTQFHVLYLQEHLHFTYVRLWNVFSTKMMICDGRTIGQYNFDLVNQILDFLVGHHLKPFLDMGRRPDTAVRTEGEPVYFREEYIAFSSRAIWEDMLNAFLLNLVNRYGLEEVSTWIFEYCHDSFHTGQETRLYDDPAYDFYEAWKYAREKIREIIPGAMIGGISAVVEHKPEQTAAFFRNCVRDHCEPDFASFILFPYKMRSSQSVVYGGEGYERQRVSQMRELLAESGLQKCPLFITEWNHTISNRNYLNDSCFRAAYMVSTLVGLREETDMMAVMAGTDWVSSFLDTNKVLNGGIGLLTKDTIGKPAFFALQFLEHMGEQVLAGGDHYLLTRKSNGDLYLLCFYFSWFRENAVTEKDAVSLEGIRQVRYEEERPLELQFALTDLPEAGEYIVKKRILGTESGSILDEWGRLGYETRLGREDIKYLQSVSIPRIELERIRTDEDGTLGAEVTLQPQEVVLLHIYQNRF